jgi:hypothetical protein
MYHVGEMRFEVRQQEGKWFVWDVVRGECFRKSVLGAVDGLRTAMLGHIAPGPVKPPETRPAMFWTQAEAQQLADFLNDFFDFFA